MSSEHTHEHGPDCDHGDGPNPLAVGGVLALVTMVVALVLLRRRRNARRQAPLPRAVGLLSKYGRKYGRTVSERAHAMA